MRNKISLNYNGNEPTIKSIQGKKSADSAVKIINKPLVPKTKGGKKNTKKNKNTKRKTKRNKNAKRKTKKNN